MVGQVTETDKLFLFKEIGNIIDERNYKLPSEYIESVRYLRPALTPFPGQFSFDKFPYFREIIDQFSPESPTRRVFFMKGNQIGATTALLESIMMYYIGEVPAPVIYVLPDEQMTKTAMEEKIDPAIDDCGLRDKISTQTKQAKGSKKTGDTQYKKEYAGGYLHAAWAGSGNRFRNFSYKIGLVDEADGMQSKVKGEGALYDLIKARLDAYPTSSKLYIGSTPAEERSSLINELFKSGTQKYYYIPCKYCGTMQRLEFTVWDPNDKSKKIGGLVWEVDEDFVPLLDTVGYQCPHCGGIMKNYDKAELMQKGEWRATAIAKQPNTESYHLTALYNPPGMFSWEDYVSDWAGCWDLKTNKVRNKDKYRVFRNLKQGLTYLDQNEQIKYEKAVLHRRFGFAKSVVPNRLAMEEAGSPVLIVVCSVDVQEHNLFVDVKGYADRGVTYTLDFFSIEGETQSFDGPWNPLDDYINNTIFTDNMGRKYKIAITLIDSGHYTKWVYAFCQRHSNGVYACKGNDWIEGGRTYKKFNASTLQDVGLDVAYHVNTGKQKDSIVQEMNRLLWEDGKLQPAWYPNFPETLGDDYYKMFEAEEKVELYDKNNHYLKTVWRCKSGMPNHAFDTYVYNKTALEILATDFCCLVLGLASLDWESFWDYAKTEKAFYWEE